MKPFDLEAAKRGEPILMDAAHTGWQYQGPVFFVGVGENGIPVVEIQERPTRVAPEFLSMAPRKRTVWVNLHRQHHDGSIVPFAYEDGEHAKRMRESSMNCAGFCSVEIEE